MANIKKTSFPKKVQVLLIAFLTIVLAVIGSQGIQNIQTQTETHASQCQINGVLPDRECTPGAIDPRVTQANIHETICVAGYTKTVRPPTSYTNKLKAQQIIEYGYEDTDLSNYEEDHLINLSIGGHPTDPKNLWPEPGPAPNPKDTVELRCQRKVCNGEILLAEAQRQIATNWTTACE